jgi:ElaA protein
MIHWTYKNYNDLTTDELYRILSLRSKVFVVEQNCVYQDLDNKDQKSWHLLGYINDTLVAYARLLPPGLSYAEASIGRVITHPDYRQKGYGIALMQLAIKNANIEFATQKIKISAQCYLIKFYESFGFKILGEEYLEDDIPHIEMILNEL